MLIDYEFVAAMFTRKLMRRLSSVFVWKTKTDQSELTKKGCENTFT